MRSTADNELHAVSKDFFHTTLPLVLLKHFYLPTPTSTDAGLAHKLFYSYPCVVNFDLNNKQKLISQTSFIFITARLPVY